MPTDAIQMSQRRHLSKVCDPCQSHTSLNDGAHKHAKANLKLKIKLTHFWGGLSLLEECVIIRDTTAPGFPAVSVFMEFCPPCPHLSAAAIFTCSDFPWMFPVKFILFHALNTFILYYSNDITYCAIYHPKFASFVKVQLLTEGRMLCTRRLMSKP